MTNFRTKGSVKLDFIRNIPQYVQKSQEWLNQRKGKLTSSDVATALGLNPYQKPIELLFSKNHAGKPFTGNIATLYGQHYESEAAAMYEALMGKENHEFGLISFNDLEPIRKKSKLTEWLLEHPEIDTNWISGSPDGLSIDKDGFEDLILIEIKSPMRRKIEFGKIPVYYLPQVMMNMTIFDIDVGDFIEYVPINTGPHFLEKPQINIVRVHMDYDWLFNALPILDKFWKEVLYWREKGIINHPEYLKYGYENGISIRSRLKQEKKDLALLTSARPLLTSVLLTRPLLFEENTEKVFKKTLTLDMFD